MPFRGFLWPWWQATRSGTWSKSRCSVAFLQHAAEIADDRSVFTDLAFFPDPNRKSSRMRCDMKKILAAAAITLAFAPSAVLAQERVGDAALGALSGAVVLGPVGAVAGAVVGYTAGPSIAHSWGLRRSDPRHGERSGRASGNAASNQKPPTQEAATSRPVEENSARPAKPSTQSASVQNAMPPVQTLE
jgi:hypothetical protein